MGLLLLPEGGLTVGSAQALPQMHSLRHCSPAAFTWEHLVSREKVQCYRRHLKLMSTPAVKHVFECVLGGKTRSEYSREYLFPLGICVLLVVYFMDRVGPICLGEGVWLSNVLTVSVLRSHCLGTLVLTFKCIFQIQ